DSASISPMVGAGFGVQLLADFMAKEISSDLIGIPIKECRGGFDLLFVYDSKTDNPCIPLLREALTTTEDPNDRGTLR
ncbi:MAG: hypothetical protein J6I64_08905, partial [Lachnospiraceae bacterium]|nr:hypothetical protein [Lachnospiraceae bacterium]